MGRFKSLDSLKSFLPYQSINQSSGLTIGSNCNLMAARLQVFFSFLSFLRGHQITLEGCNCWWLCGTHSRTLAWRIPWTKDLVGCGPWGRRESDTTERFHFGFSLSCLGEGNGNPLQYSCLENPRARGAWWAAVYGVTHSQTRLKQLNSSSSMTYLFTDMTGNNPLLKYNT